MFFLNSGSTRVFCGITRVFRGLCLVERFGSMFFLLGSFGGPAFGMFAAVFHAVYFWSFGVDVLNKIEGYQNQYH